MVVSRKQVYGFSLQDCLHGAATLLQAGAIYYGTEENNDVT